MSQNTIGIVCNRLASGGGMESHALSIISEIANCGYEPIIFTKNYKHIDNIGNYKINSFCTKFIPRICEDVFFSYWLKRAKKIAGVKNCIGFCRNCESEILLCGGTHRGFIQYKNRNSIYDSITANFENRAFQKAKFILPASQFIANELRNLYHISSAKIRIAYPPLSLQKFKSFSDTEKLKARSNLGLSKDKIILLFPSASGHERKGLPFILENIKGIPNIELAIAGKPIQSTSSSVVNIGYQSDMSQAYNAADYTILASYYEPFGLVGVESILCGTPVILADNIGCTEVISKEACLSFSRKNPESLRNILKSLKKGQKTSCSDIGYDYSAKHQAQMILSLLFD